MSEGLLPDAPFFDAALDVCGCLAREGPLACEQNIHHDPTAPDVAQFIVATRQDLGRHVVRRPQHSSHMLPRLKPSGHTEVNQLDVTPS